jgi:hypothetical protein
MIIITGVPKVLGQMSLYFSSAKIGFGKIKKYLFRIYVERAF